MVEQDIQRPSTTVLSIVVPVYYNGASLRELFVQLNSLEERLGDRGVGLELIFVNDGSGDDSLSELLAIKRMRPATKVVSLSRNFGAVAASKAALSFVTGDAFMFLAADLQDPPEQALPMLDRWLAGSKFVVSARATRADPPMSRLSAWMYYRIIELLALPSYPRGGFDLMLMDRIMLPYIINCGKNTNPNVFAFWLGFTPVILPYDRRKRLHGSSRWTFSKKLKFFVDTICGFTVVPIRAMSVFGVVAAILSCLYGIYIGVAALQGKVAVQGFATLVAMITFFSGLILMMLGTLGEYLWRVFDAVTNKPESVIDQVYL